jgi:uncharacterized surface protein with fasciclin (FAS1) repeats
MKRNVTKKFRLILGTLALSLLGSDVYSQTVYDVINTSANHTSLAAAIDAAGLTGTLQDPNGTFTVFAPDNDAIDDLAAALGVTIGDLLANPDLDDILLYHVLGAVVNSGDLSNGQIAQPLNPANTIKITTGAPGVFINHAEVNAADLPATNGVVHSLDAVVLPALTVADVAIGSAAHTTLVAAVIEARLLPALTNPFAALTVFAPTDDAFGDALAALDLTAAQLLASPDLTDILLYHVLGAEVASGDLTNGQLAQPLNPANTLKVTLNAGDVFINQAQVSAANLPAENGIVHVLDAVVLPALTVADVAIGSAAHTTLVAAVIEARLLPALTNPFAALTVFAPTDDAFGDALAALDLTAAQLLASPDLTDILLYHVLGAEVASGDLTNGQLAQPLNPANTLKVTLNAGDVFINQAQVSAANLPAENGIVHVLDAVVLPNSTVADVAIGSAAHTTLVAAVIEARLLPALTNPFTALTVFAPTDDAFEALATALDVDVADLLELPSLTDILLYHVVAGTVLSTDLENGPVATLNGQDVVIDLTSGVLVNDATVTAADLTAENGVVHVIDAVLIPEATNSLNEATFQTLSTYPNPAIDYIRVKGVDTGAFVITDMTGAVVLQGTVNADPIAVNGLNTGTYIINITSEQGTFVSRIVKM